MKRMIRLFLALCFASLAASPAAAISVDAFMQHVAAFDSGGISNQDYITLCNDALTDASNSASVRVLILATRGQAYYNLNEKQKALDDGNAVVAADPYMAAGYVTLVNIATGKKDFK